MKLVCPWCKKHYADKGSTRDFSTSYILCPKCKVDFLKFEKTLEEERAIILTPVKATAEIEPSTSRSWWFPPIRV